MVIGCLLETEQSFRKYASENGIDLNYCARWQLLEVRVRYDRVPYRTDAADDSGIPIVPGFPNYIRRLLHVETVRLLEDEASLKDADDGLIASGSFFSDDLGNHFRVDSIVGDVVYVRDAMHKNASVEEMDYETVRLMIESTFE